MSASPVQFFPQLTLAAELDAARSDLERFLSAAQGLELREALRVTEAYLIWADLLRPRRRGTALTQLRADINEPAKALSRIQFALAYDPQFDARAITQHLARREALGGLDDDELRAALVLRLHSNNAVSVAQLIAKYRAQFDANFGRNPILAIEIHALAMSNDAASAKILLDANKELLGEEAVARLGAEIARAEGADPVVEYMRAYEATKTPDTLRALLGALFRKETTARSVPTRKSFSSRRRTPAIWLRRRRLTRIPATAITFCASSMPVQ
jgi:hypothetical protein